MAVNYFYGPVLSRRLGFSLGVDIIPRKTCSFDCIYCQLGPQVKRTLNRKRWVDMPEFRRQLRAIMKTEPVIDYITISGSGEPTLHEGLDKIIAAIKTITRKRYPVCVITNSSLLYSRKVRHELRRADLIIPSLDAARISTFRRINKPHKDCSLKKIISGLKSLRKEYRGKIWLEIMLVAGLNDRPQEIRAFKEIIGKINPDKVQINIPLRPTPQVVPIPTPADIAKIQAALLEAAGAETVCNIEPKRKQRPSVSGVATEILRLLRVRPETAKNMAKSLSMKEVDLSLLLRRLLAKKIIKKVRRKQKTYFIVND